MISTWERAIKLSFTSENLQVKEHMKRNIWNNNSRDKHLWWFVKVENRIYQKVDDFFQIWIPNGRNSRRVRYKKSEHIELDIPEGAEPASIIMNRSTIQVITSSTIEGGNNINKENPLDWNRYGWITKKINMKGNGEELAEDVRSKKAKIVCDGSYKDGISTSCFITIGDNPIVGNNKIPGRKKDQNSYRAELGGVLGSVILTKACCNKNNVEEGLITIGCDNKGVVDALNGYRRPNSRWKSFDLVCRIRKKMEQSQIKWVMKHIYGHQDEKLPIEELDEWAKTNVKCDKGAKEYMKKKKK